jgi:hypothetical protein
MNSSPRLAISAESTRCPVCASYCKHSLGHAFGVIGGRGAPPVGFLRWQGKVGPAQPEPLPCDNNRTRGFGSLSSATIKWRTDDGRCSGQFSWVSRVLRRHANLKDSTNRQIGLRPFRLFRPTRAFWAILSAFSNSHSAIQPNCRALQCRVRLQWAMSTWAALFAVHAIGPKGTGDLWGCAAFSARRSLAALPLHCGAAQCGFDQCQSITSCCA